MTTRVKSGIGFLISGAVLIVCGVIYLKVATNPTWLTVLLSALGGAASSVGLTLSLPASLTSSSTSSSDS